MLPSIRAIRNEAADVLPVLVTDCRKTNLQISPVPTQKIGLPSALPISAMFDVKKADGDMRSYFKEHTFLFYSQYKPLTLSQENLYNGVEVLETANFSLPVRKRNLYQKELSIILR